MAYLLLNRITDEDGITQPIVINAAYIAEISKDAEGCAIITMTYGHTLSLEETFDRLVELLSGGPQQ